MALAAFCACLHGHAGASAAVPDSLRTKTDTVVSGRMLPEVTVEASSRKADRSTAPKFELGASSLKAIGATDISSALKRLPGINLKDYGGHSGTTISNNVGKQPQRRGGSFALFARQRRQSVAHNRR